MKYSGKNDFPSKEAGILLTILLFFMCLMIYSFFFRDFLTIVWMPDIDGKIAQVDFVQMEDKSWIMLKSGERITVPDRLAYMAERGMHLHHEASSFTSSLDGERVRIFRFTPLLLFALSLTILILTSLNNPAMGALILFLFANRIGKISIAHLLFPAILFASIFLIF